MKIRIKFRKWGVMKFVGHLDLMRYFQKAVNRANIDICYSEGFSPHQIMSFAAPLGVGVTSDGEYFDIEVHTSMSSKEAIAALNQVMVDGGEVTGYVVLPEKAKTAMAIVSAADYTLSYKEGYENPYTVEQWRGMIDEAFHKKETFSIIKKTKKSERELDLKPLVYELKVLDSGAFFLKVSTGSTDNLKPELVLASIFERCQVEYNPDAMQIHRMEVYATDETTGNFVSLLDMGEPI